MKTKAYACLVGMALITAAQAGSASSELQGSSLWQWFTGGSVGYLTDLDHAMYNVQVGMEYRTPGDQTSHSLYLQLGYTQDDAGYGHASAPGGVVQSASVDLHIIPVTANYKYEAPLSGNLHYYVGLGVGFVIMNYTNDWTWYQVTAPPFPHGSGTDDQTDVRLYSELFGGLSYNISQSFEFFGGARFDMMSNVDHNVNVIGAPKFNAGINHDFLFELGARYHF